MLTFNYLLLLIEISFSSNRIEVLMITILQSPVESKGIHKLSISAINPFSRLELPLFVDKEFAFGDHVDHHVGM